MDRIVNLKQEPDLVEQYVTLRNSYLDLLMSIPVSVTETRQWLKRPGIEVLGLASGDQLLGAIVLYVDRGNEVALFVRCPGRGVGPRLLTMIEDAARGRGLSMLWAWVLIRNTVAAKIFDKAGYVRVGVTNRIFQGKTEFGIEFRKPLTPEARLKLKSQHRKGTKDGHADNLRVVLFGMTGFGNSALHGLMAMPDVEMAGIVCRTPEHNPFPYYHCPKIEEEAASWGIPVLQGARLSDPASVEAIAKFGPDLIVVCTFRQVLPPPIIALPQFGVINIHPSLLPKYRGPTPTFWSILNGEQESGLTVHFIEDERFDAGPIVVQRRVPIKPDETDGELRHRLSQLCAEVIREAVQLVTTLPHTAFPAQDESLSTYFPMRTPADAKIDASRPLDEIQRRIRAATPWPGARLEHGGQEFIVTAVDRDLGGAQTAAEPGFLIVQGSAGYRRFRMANYDG